MTLHWPSANRKAIFKSSGSSCIANSTRTTHFRFLHRSQSFIRGRKVFCRAEESGTEQQQEERQQDNQQQVQQQQQQQQEQQDNQQQDEQQQQQQQQQEAEPQQETLFQLKDLINSLSRLASERFSTAVGSSARSRPSVEEAATAAANVSGAQQLSISVVHKISQVPAAEWDGLATSGGEVNPFLLHAFFHALEESGSAARHEGWLPYHILARDAASGELLGAVPMYLKTHSSGEYVFDHSWASFSEQRGMPYYPKLQCCVPFTPVTGSRFLVRPSAQRKPLIQALAKALIAIADTLEISSVHVTFNNAEEWHALGEVGFLQRTGVQYHWDNNDFTSFEDFLATLKQSKRKTIRQERKGIGKQGLTVRRLSGDDLTPAHWDAFYEFYVDTVDRKWGSAYLTRDFFHRLGVTMADKVMLAVAYEGSEMIAGALNLVGSHALYGRNWGMKPGMPEFKHLHFELCYYQALDEAIERKLPRVEAGAQGEHKLQRGYLPSLTYSSHYFRDPLMRAAVSRFLLQERVNIDFRWQALLLQASPFKRDATVAAFRSRLDSYSSSSTDSWTQSTDAADGEEEDDRAGEGRWRAARQEDEDPTAADTRRAGRDDPEADQGGTAAEGDDGRDAAAAAAAAAADVRSARGDDPKPADEGTTAVVEEDHRDTQKDEATDRWRGTVADTRDSKGDGDPTNKQVADEGQGSSGEDETSDWRSSRAASKQGDASSEEEDEGAANRLQLAKGGATDKRDSSGEDDTLDQQGAVMADRAGGRG